MLMICLNKKRSINLKMPRIKEIMKVAKKKVKVKLQTK
jgi:hypothetical protein